MHPSTCLRLSSEEIGLGVFATKFIPRGTITWILDPLDRVFPPQEVAWMQEYNPEIIDRYCYRDARGDYVLCWDLARYVNHSFRPSCFLTPYQFEVAIRDIEPGEELTSDYGYLNVSEPFYAADEGTERTVVYPDDLARHAPEWDRLVLSVLPSVLEVPQPFRTLVPQATWDELALVCRGERPMPSLAAFCYHPPQSAVRRPGG
ncbi:MAG: SET domain-containing protein [Leptospiraceae bacterium]|nr:SET domain-containing protein [Leptospiraceae bacterium]